MDANQKNIEKPSEDHDKNELKSVEKVDEKEKSEEKKKTKDDDEADWDNFSDLNNTD